MTASEPVDDTAPGVSDIARPGTAAPRTASEHMAPAAEHTGDPPAEHAGDPPAEHAGDPPAAALAGAGETMSASPAGKPQAAPGAAEPTASTGREHPGVGRNGPDAAERAGADVPEPADTTGADAMRESPVAADTAVAAPETRDAAPAPVAPSRVTPSAGAPLIVESTESATTTGTAQARPAGDSAAPTATPVVSRVVELVERLRTEPPPRQLVIDLDQFGVGRLVISLRGDTVLVGAADGGARPDPQWWSELGEALDQRGWSLDGGGEQPSHDRQQPQSQSRPAPSFLTQPRRRVHTDRGLRL
jgi:hypothetical protein